MARQSLALPPPNLNRRTWLRQRRSKRGIRRSTSVRRTRLKPVFHRRARGLFLILIKERLQIENEAVDFSQIFAAPLSPGEAGAAAPCLRNPGPDEDVPVSVLPPAQVCAGRLRLRVTPAPIAACKRAPLFSVRAATDA